MKIAITGECGFLGYHLTQYYLNKGYKVVSLGRNYLENLQLVKNCNFIIHAAGVNRANSDQEVYDANIKLAHDLASKLKQLDLKVNIKFISSIQELNGSIYGNAKLKAKELLTTYCNESNTTFESYLLPNLFGTHGKPNYNSVVNTFAYNIINGLECKYNENIIKLCWVYDAINVIDNQSTDYILHETSVKELYCLLHDINKIDIISDLIEKQLKQILTYYKKTKILILGHTGMLGHMVKIYFEKQNFNVVILTSRFGDAQFETDIKNFNGGFIINCIGAIPQRTNYFKINTDLPIWLSNNSPCQVIHPGTDCEMDDDDYGISKRLANEYIQMYSTNTKVLKTSIIGPENGTCFGLMEWFLSQEGEVNGYTQAIWNGNTTLEWAKQCHNLIDDWNEYNKQTILEGKPISKFDMLNLFNIFYNKNIKINPIDLGKNKCLIGNIKTKPLKEQLEELKKFII